MGKNKLRKFSEMASMANVYQYPFGVLRQSGGCPMRGKWGAEVFGNDNPIILELGCGKGEYTVGLAERFPDTNFIGIDIKGARMWTGARDALARGIANAAFLRTSIELLDSFFTPGEVAGLWITFPDPQMKKASRRLTGTRMLELYRRVLAPRARINLKTDSPFLYTYTREMLRENGIAPLADITDLHNPSAPGVDPWLREIKTYYEQQWISRGLSIKYLAWNLDGAPAPLAEPDVEIEPDTYRSFARGQLQMPHPVEQNLPDNNA